MVEGMNFPLQTVIGWLGRGALGAMMMVVVATAQEPGVLRQIQEIGRRAAEQQRRVQLEYDRERLEARDGARGEIAAAKREITAAAMRRDDSVNAAMFAAAEREAELECRTIPLLDAAQQRALAKIDRERVAEQTAVHARTLDVGDEDQNRQMRNYLRQSGEIEQRWQEQFDQLDYEWERARIELQREERRAHNVYDREVKIVYLELQEEAAEKGLSVLGLESHPRLLELMATRDEALNAIARRVDEAQLEHDARRSEAEGKKEEELAAILP